MNSDAAGEQTDIYIKSTQKQAKQESIKKKQTERFETVSSVQILH
jgi:hypothetical protein